MIKFNKLAQIAKKYAFNDAVAKDPVKNGVFGSVDSDGEFTPGANAAEAVMQIEVGDDSNMPTYSIPAGTHFRVVDLKAFDGEKIEIYDYPLPDTYAEGDKLVSDVTGALKVDASASAPYFEIDKIIGRNQGVRAVIVAK